MLAGDGKLAGIQKGPRLTFIFSSNWRTANIVACRILVPATLGLALRTAVQFQFKEMHTRLVRHARDQFGDGSVGQSGHDAKRAMGMIPLRRTCLAQMNNQASEFFERLATGEQRPKLSVWPSGFGSLPKFSCHIIHNHAVLEIPCRAAINMIKANVLVKCYSYIALVWPIKRAGYLIGDLAGSMVGVVQTGTC